MGIRNWHQIKRSQGQVKVIGSRVVGESLTVEAMAGWIITAVQWLRDGVAIDGATGTSYSLTTADEGAVVYPLVTGYSAVSVIVAAGAPAATELTPFTVGTLCFGVASLDAYVYGTATQQTYAERMWSDDGETVDVVCDAVSGSTIGDWQTNILPVLLARSGTENLVVVLSNPLGNDTTNAVSTYGRADAAPESYWTSRIAVLADGVAQLQAAGIRVIVGNNSYRNYGLDDSCRADEDKGARFVNRTHLEPWIQANMPECWDSAAGQPMLNAYGYIWNLGNWFFNTDDQTHPNIMGIQALRRYNHSVVSAMAAGNIPPAITQRGWPDAGDASTDVVRTVVGFGSAATLDLMPSGINHAVVAAASTVNTYITFPATMVDADGAASPVKIHSYGWYSVNATGRGNDGDETVSLTNDALLSGAASLGSASNNNKGFIEFGGLTPFGRYKVRAAASASTGSQVKTSWVYVNSYTDYQECEPKTVLPEDYLEFDAIADSIGFIHLLVLTASGSVAGYLSGAEVESAA